MSHQQPPVPSKWNDFEIEVIIGTLLRTGVILAATVVLLGGVLYLSLHALDVPNYTQFHGEPASLKHPKEIFQGVMQLDARAIIQLGLLLLIATPVVRVAFSAVAFAIERDSMYVIITLIVLVVLLFSLFSST
jgi:uncharacterized membrane protein